MGASLSRILFINSWDTPHAKAIATRRGPVPGGFPESTRIAMPPFPYLKPGSLSLLLHLCLLMALGSTGWHPAPPPKSEPPPIAFDIVEPSRLLGDGSELLAPGCAPAPAHGPTPPATPSNAPLPRKTNVALTAPPQPPPIAPMPVRMSAPPPAAAEGPDLSVPVPSPPSVFTGTRAGGPAGIASGSGIATDGDTRGDGTGHAGSGQGGGYIGAGLQIGERPPYPDTARQQGIEGMVVLRILVDAQGLPASVAIRRSSGHAVLDQAALKASAKWRFSPARKNGRPIASFHDVRIRFRLDEED
jgi:protein TonB